MAIFHFNAKVISRGKGQSAIAAAAYRSGERLRDEQANEQKFYQTRAERIVSTHILTPKDAPEWAQDRNQLWNHAERAEKRKDARLAREFEVGLPHELTEQQREWLIKDFAREAFVRKGYVVDIAIHAPDKDSDERNHHAHLMVTTRTLGAEGFAAQLDRSLNSREQLGAWREQWANLANRHLERHGHDARIDHRNLKEQGIDREAGVHLGYAANEMAQRGAQSDRMDALKGVIARNDIRLEMKQLDGELLGQEAERRQAPRRKAESPLDWTDHAGLVAQQQAAMRNLKRNAPESAPAVFTEPKPAVPPLDPTPKPEGEVSEHRKKLDWILGAATPEPNGNQPDCVAAPAPAKTPEAPPLDPTAKPEEEVSEHRKKLDWILGTATPDKDGNEPDRGNTRGGRGRTR